MNLIEIKCPKCTASLQVNSELPKCMCQYCGAEIQLASVPSSIPANGIAPTVPASITTDGTVQTIPANAAMEGTAQSLTANSNDLNAPSQPAANGTAQSLTANSATDGTAQAIPSQPVPTHDDPNEVAKYKNMMKMNIIVGIVAFILLFFIRYNIVLTGAIVIFLIALPLREANKCLKAKELLIRNGSQKGNIVGLAVLIMLDVLFWILKLISQFASI